MKRSKQYNYNEQPAPLTKAGKWIIGLNSIINFFQMVDVIKPIHREEWSSWDDEEGNLFKEKKKEVRKEMVVIFNKTGFEKMVNRLIDFYKYAPPALSKLKKLMGEKYRRYFYLFNSSLPSNMARPFVPFYPVSKKIGAFVNIAKPIKKGTKSGRARLTISGVLPYARDIKTLYALNKIKTKNKLKCNQQFIILDTTVVEMNKELRLKNPYDDKTKVTLKNSLKRLRKCTITLEGYDDKTFNIGGIIAKAKSYTNGKLKIALDRDFFELFKFGYLPINEEIFYSLKSDRVILLYIWLLGQIEFNKHGKLGYKDKISIKMVYEKANLTGIGMQKKPYQKRYYINKSLSHLKECGVIRYFSLEGDYVKLERCMKV